MLPPGRHFLYHSAPRRLMRARRALGLAVVAAAGVHAAPGRAESVVELLAAVATNARFETPARADVRVECTPACTPAAVIVVGRGDDLYLEGTGGLRALVRPGQILVRDGERTAEATVGRTLGDTPLLLEDLRVFVADALKVPQISDDGPERVVVTGAPARASAYALLVHTIDRERDAIVKTQYYRDSISNLVKIRRDSAYVQVGSRWRPGEIQVESLRDARRAVLRLAWREAPDTPTTLFEPRGLDAPSGLVPPSP
jgi:hypothetical protein